MRYLKHVTALACAFILLLPAKFVLAEWKPDGSVETASYSSVIVPIFLSLQIQDSIEESTPENRRYRREEKERHEARRRKAQTHVPDMQVKEIIIVKNERYNIEQLQIRFEDPHNPENYAVLTTNIWYKDNHKIGKLKEGDGVVFQNSTIGVGWDLKDDQGENLVFVPVDHLQFESFSEPF